MDKIIINGLACRCRIGVPAEERKTKQTILIDAEFSLSLAKAGKTDDVRHAPDYHALEKALRACAEEKERKLIECLAEDLAAVALRFDKKIKETLIRVRKSPAVMPGTKNVAVEIKRRRT